MKKLTSSPHRFAKYSKVMLKSTIPLLLSASLLSAYIVQDKDTLWDLGDKFLGNPFQWTEIWEANPQIKNPHLIHPGDTLNIKGTSSQKMPEPQFEPKETPKGMTSQGNISQDVLRKKFRASIGVLGNQRDEFEEFKNRKAEGDFNSNWREHHLNKHLIFTSPFLVESYNDLKSFKNEFQIQGTGREMGGIAQPHQQILINAGTKQSLTQGEILEVFNPHLERIEIDKKQYAPYRLGALAEIKECSENNCKAELIQVYGRIDLNKARATQIISRENAEVESYTSQPKAEYRSLAKIKYVWRNTEISASRIFVSINQGKAKNYNLGDAVVILRKNEIDEKLSPTPIAVGIILNSSSHHSTLLVRNLTNSSYNIEENDLVALTHKAELTQNQEIK